MFTGIIEEIGVVEKVEKDQDNIHFTLIDWFYK
jgi:riboflavin synthase alpha subunit